MPWGTFPQLLGSRPEAVMCHPRPGSMVTPPFPSSPMFVTLITLYSSPAGHLLVPWMCCFFFLGGSVCVHPSHLTYSSGLSRGACVDVAGLVRSRWHVALTSRTLLFCMSIGIKPCFIVVGFIVVQFIVLRRYCVFYELKVCGNSIEQVCWCHFSNSICSLRVCHILVILPLYLSWWLVVSDLWCYYCHCFAPPPTTPT